MSREPISQIIKSTFTNGNLKRGGYVAVPTALLSVIGTILAQQYILPQHSGADVSDRLAVLESSYEEGIRERDSWRASHKEIADQIVRRLEDKMRGLEIQSERIETKVDRLLRRDP